MDFLDATIDLLDKAIKEDASNALTAWTVIQKWFSKQVDGYQKTIDESNIWLSEYKEEIITSTWIQNLKIKYTSNAGYFIEISKSKTWEVPSNFIFTQGLTQVTRYTTLELQEFQQRIDEALYRIGIEESNAFFNICSIILEQNIIIDDLSKRVAQLDFLQCGAYISLKSAYSRPKVSEWWKLKIEWWKHPVLASFDTGFVSNDLELSKYDRVHVITWPNMWWKSTYLRQNALLILMSHIGFDIPTKNACIPLTDKIFSRVGAGDNIFLGQSTFMVEMQEISYILRHATEKSFVIIDEIGRGTSTYDGMSLAWAILKFIHSEIKSKTLFATHYHEIVDHVSELKAANNYSIAVWENSENIVFLRKVIPGGMKKSYGIAVAKLAWVPSEVLKQAQKTMNDYQFQWSLQQFHIPFEAKSPDWEQSSELQWLKDNILNLDVNSISPIEALSLLDLFQKQLKK